MAKPPPPIPGIRNLTSRLAPVFEVWIGTARDAAHKESPREPEEPLAAMARVLDSIDRRIGLRKLMGDRLVGDQTENAERDGAEQLVPLAGPWGDQPEQHTNDVISVVFEESVEGNFPLSKVRVQLHNVYDAEAKTYRYTDIPSSTDRQGRFPIIDYGKSIVLRIGYPLAGSLDDIQTVFEGIVVQIETGFPADGEPTVAITAVDRRDRLRSHRGKKRSFRPRNVEELIAEVAAMKGLCTAVATRPKNVPHRTAIDAPIRLAADQDLLQFIVDQAKRNSLELTAFGDTIFVHDPGDAGPADLEYIYREGLISFTAALNGSGHPTEVSVVWHDTRTNKRETVRVTPKDLAKSKLTVQSDTVLDRIRTSGKSGDRALVITNFTIEKASEAKRLATAVLKNKLDLAFTAAGEVLGDPLLRVRKVIKIGGTGRYDGNYYVTMTRHRFGANGYQTSFNARRNAALETAQEKRAQKQEASATS